MGIRNSQNDWRNRQTNEMKRRQRQIERNQLKQTNGLWREGRKSK